MILAWVLSLLMLCSSLIVYLERMATLSIVEPGTMSTARRGFIAAEKAVIECEKNISNISALTENACFIQPAGKNIWLITSKQKPGVQIHVFLDEKTGVASRLNWRQVFE
ncbi:hypothetical protein [Polynucleobacter sp. AP-Latsch-80-C2]|uniref:hypothetical protein n=1 Tax=Polynucleobacter sp. AP-Latsch-80-C2 TaxID=2576931 RepID=UPI001C0D74EE|nr:hypothetical protein [Polynucleobacter sp. AP-Latsch-80-C2]